jgi:uncharacterized protein YqjF (DUF2071 family)
MRIFLTAEWRHLLMLNYRVEPELLIPYLPAGLELDTWNGIHYASLIGFRFLSTRVLRVPVPLHTSFEEVNLRFYVRRRTQEGDRRGVVFLREIVPRKLVAGIARICYHEPYIALPMRHKAQAPEARKDGLVQYSWRHEGVWNVMRGTTRGEPASWSEGSEEQFITEHYWGYTRQPDGRCKEYQVLHEPWKIWPVADPTFSGDPAALYGTEFGKILLGTPCSAFVADGSPVTVGWGKLI